MRIQFISNYSQLYGANRILLILLEYLKQKGYTISVLLPAKGDMAKELELKGIPYKVIPYYSSFLYFKRTFKFMAYPLLVLLNFINFPKILSAVRTFNPDVIYSNTSAENFGVFIAKVLNKKHITHVHEFMSLDHKSYFFGGNKLKRRFIDKSDAVIFVTKSVAEYVIGANLSEKHIVVYNGLTTNEEPIQIIEKKRNLDYGIIGIFSEGKRQHLAIKYFANILHKYPTAKLHIYGDKEGSYKQRLFRLVKQMQLEENIIFHGFVKDIDLIYSNIDVLLVFSESEGFGLVTVEAMLRGVPVIGYNNAGTSEIIEDGKSGYLFVDEMSFTHSVDKLQHFDNYVDIRNNAYSRAKSTFSANAYCKNIENIIIKSSNE